MEEVPPLSSNALTLDWSFGFKDKVHSLASDNRSAIFYTTAHTGIIYDYASKSQQLLQGHCNEIVATCVSEDKKWIATADAGPDSVIVVWDSLTGTPVKTIFAPHEGGVAALAISGDSMFLASLGKVEDGMSGEQELSLWEWSAETDSALYTCAVPDVQSSMSAHTSVAFNPGDARELVTNGDKKIVFWTWESYKLVPFSPLLSKSDKKTISHFSFVNSIFVPDKSTAITSTTCGEVVLWDAVEKEEGDNNDEDEDIMGGPGYSETNPLKSMVKSIKLCEGKVNFISFVVGKYLVVAGEDGCVRFYDGSLRIMAWYEDLNAGPVTSVSFATNMPTNVDERSDFCCPDFVVGTSTSYIIGVECALFQEIEPDNRRGAVLVQGIGDEVPCVATHPTMDRLVIGVYDGTLQLWDLMSRTLLVVEELVGETGAKQRPQCIQYDGVGRSLAVGMTSGLLKVMDPDSFQETASFVNGDQPITFLRFSPDSTWLTCADAGNYVYLYQFAVVEEDIVMQPEDDESWNPPEPSPTWNYIGRYKSHSGSITGIEFATREDGRLALVSVGEDRMLVEYDLVDVTAETGLKLRNEPTKIEQTAIPTTCLWHPLLGGDFEDRVITANNEFKFKQWNADNKSCRKTSLCPTFGGPLTSLSNIPQHNPEKNLYGPSPYLVYSTAEKVVGVVKVPLDGNPAKAMGLIAHPTAISSVSVSGDGRFVVTAGGADKCVNVWRVSTKALEMKIEEAMVKADGTGSASMYSELIDAETKEDLIDYFYYAQLRTQGEDTTEEREITGTVPLEEIPNLVRALGYYPSEQECQNMIQEVYYANFTETGETNSTIDLDTFIKLYVNHKPVFGTSKDEITEAFKTLGGNVQWATLTNLLKEKGEGITEEDFKNILTCLMGKVEGAGLNPSSFMDAGTFSDKVLGFEDTEGEE
mmetsp:Transcript_20905/g.43637  ORF Transcript_20905/g.43637 Transcript_20905/m.43637 type:complete len:926 (+) Transcript_20905:54-2831(+)